MGCLGGGPEALQRVTPERVEVLAERGDRLRVDVVDAARARRTIDDEPDVLQHLQVLGDGRPADRKLVRQLPDGPRTVAQPFEDLPPMRIAERLERLTLV